MKRIIGIMMILILVLPMSSFAGQNTIGMDGYMNSLNMIINETFVDEIDNIGYWGLPHLIRVDLETNHNYDSNDVTAVVRLKPSSTTLAATLVIQGANIVNDNVGYGITYMDDGLDGVLNALAENVVGTAVSESGTPGKYTMYAYALSEDLSTAYEIINEFDEIKDLASAQTIGLTLATKLLEAEMNYINNNMPKGLENLHKLDYGTAGRLEIYAVHIDAYNETEKLMEKGVMFYHNFKNQYAETYPNYYNNMVYSSINIYPDYNAEYQIYKNAEDAITRAELSPSRVNILNALALVDTVQNYYERQALQQRTDALLMKLNPELLTSGSEEVVFADPNLESAVRSAAGKPSGTLMVMDVAHVESINVNSSGISSLEGLQYLSNLKRLDAARNSISSIEPIRNLHGLTYISLHNNNITDIGPLAGKSKLTTLILWSNSISDLSPIYNLYDLSYLDVSRNNLTDIMPIRELTNLETLSIAYNNISSIEAVRHLTKLVHFYIGGNPIYDTSPTDEYYHNILRKDF